MTALPPIANATGASVTEGGFKSWLTDLRAMLAETIGATGGGQSDAASGSVFRRNAWYNGAMQVWQRGTGSTSSSAGSRTYLADRIYVNPAGAALNQLRSATIPSGSRVQYSLELQGAASVTAVLVGQRLIASDIPRIKRTITFQAQVQNLSGAAFNPSLLIGTPNAADDFTTVVNRLTQSLQSCTDSAWTQVSHTVDISAYTNIDNGLQVELQIPSGSLVSGDTVRITEVQLAASAVVTTLDVLPFAEELSRCLPYYAKSFLYATVPVQNAGLNTGETTWAGYLAAALATNYEIVYPVRMRATPTHTWFNPAAANALVRDRNASADTTSNSTVNATERGITVQATQNAAHAAGGFNCVHWTAAAEP